jgi:adenosine kinase
MRTIYILSLQQLSEIKTGTCLCLCQGESRSLTANIGAALNMEKEFIEMQLETFTSNPSIYYIEGFFIPQKMHICRFLYDKYTNNPDTLLVTNLNAPYIVKSFTKDITWLTKKADIVFGNRDEVT